MSGARKTVPNQHSEIVFSPCAGFVECVLNLGASIDTGIVSGLEWVQLTKAFQLRILGNDEKELRLDGFREKVNVLSGHSLKLPVAGF